MRTTRIRQLGRRRGSGALAFIVVTTVALSLVAVGDVLAVPEQPSQDSAGSPLDQPVRFYVEPETNAGRQADIWAADGRTEDAAFMRALSGVSQAIWFTSGTPAQVEAAVNGTVAAATEQHAVPVLVAYNIPGRDCSQYSAGGAAGEQAYRDWITAFAHGIGGHQAVVILEPDGLALLSGEPWCGAGGGFGGTPGDASRVDQRFREINFAIDRLSRLPHTAVYIDAGHSAWQPINDDSAGDRAPPDRLGMASRLLRGGIAKADGFFLNASSYRFNSELIDYGTRLSKCLHLRQQTGAGGCSEADIAAAPSDPSKLPHFVVDTSRNGQGNWVPPAGVYADAQDWCNPPGRGLGVRPTTDTGNPLVDAFLWVKRPGESDGQCTRGTAGPQDPEYGAVDPAAGAWWPEYALGLAQRAEPPLAH